LTVDIIGKTAFNYDINSLYEEGQNNIFTLFNKILKAFDIQGKNLITLLIAVVFQRGEKVFVKSNKEYIESAEKLYELVLDIIKQKREAKLKGQTDTKKVRDILDILIETRDEDTGKTFTDDQLRDHVLTFLMAGHETTSTAITWTLYELTKHPEIQKKLHEEVDNVLGDKPINSFDQVEQLKYLNMVMKESLRYYPPVPMVMRNVANDDVMMNYKIPKNLMVVISPYAIHHNPKYYDNPETFDPENFSDEKIKNRHPYAFIPFLAGDRNCIGMKFAMLEFKVIMAMLFQKFEFSLAPNQNIIKRSAITMRPFPEVLLNIKKRNL